MKGLFRSRRFRQGTMATTIAVVATALIVALNLVATQLTDRYSLNLDLTPGKLFSITDSTKEYLSGLDKDVSIYVLDTETSFSGRSEYYLQAVEVLKKYALESDRISLEFIDFLADPTFAQRYPSLQLSSNSIVVSSGEKSRALTPYELYDVQSDYYGQGQITASKAEQVLTSAVLAVASDATINVALITGHNEEPLTSFTSLLSNNNYLTGEVNLSTGEIASSYSAAVIAAPQRDFTEDELRKLDLFLENGGQYGRTLLYFASGQQVQTPALDAFLADWGVGVSPGFVYESDSARYIPGDPYMAVLDFAEDAYSQSSQGAGLVPLGAYARPLSLLYENKDQITTRALLQFADSAGVVQDKEVGDPSGPIPYLVMAEAVSPDGAARSQVVVCGSSAFVDASFLGNPNFANAEYLLNLFSTLTGQEEGIFIQSKDLSVGTLNITAFQALLWGALLIVVLPLAVLIFGLVVWARRRRR